MALFLFYACEQRRSLPDFGSIRDTAEKKKVFFDFLSPIVKAENSKISHQRTKLVQIAGQIREKGTLSWWNKKELKRLAHAYEINIDPENPDPDDVNALLRRVAGVPVELVLVQAAIESAWGTSRFAKHGNNLFGERCHTKGCGIVPEDRDQGQTWEVRSFKSVSKSVQSYIHNLNTHPAYEDLRKLREIILSNGERPDGIRLAQSLLAYSERGEAYVKDVQSMIEANKEWLLP